MFLFCFLPNTKLVVTVKESLRNIAVDKQVLAIRLQECQKNNDKLRKQAIEQRKNFRNKTNQMQTEIDEIKNSLASTKVLKNRSKLFSDLVRFQCEGKLLSKITSSENFPYVKALAYF